MSDEQPPADLTFKPSNPDLNVAAVSWVKVPDEYPCAECRARGGWQPRIYQVDCPDCYGEDPYGQGVYCGQCEWCCGC